MRRTLAFVSIFLVVASDALAQADVFFGPGSAPVFREQDLDRRFLRSGLYRGLKQGTQDPNCAQVLGALFTLLAEAAPTLHKRDENFFLDPALVQALNAQLNNPRFPANAYLAAMVRRVMIDGKLPEEWLATANELNRTVGIIDLAKLELLARGVNPVDSFFFTLPALQQRYQLEVQRANSSAKDTALLAFRDAYLDRDVAWGSVYLVDVGPPKPAKGRKKRSTDEDRSYLLARLEYRPPKENPESVAAALFGPAKKEKPVVLEARLAPEQFVDVSRIPKGKRVLVRGRFWELSNDLKRLELRNALLFEDRDWSQGAVLATPQAVAMCPLAVNELAGIAPNQPGGFGHR